MKKSFFYFLVLFIAFTFTSCESTGNVQRVSADTVTDLSGYWNDTDIRLVAEEIINGCLTSPRILEYPLTHLHNYTNNHLYIQQFEEMEIILSDYKE